MTIATIATKVDLDADALVAAQQALPLATGDLPGTGGVVRVVPEDFEVEEIPLYEPSGSGEHLYLWIEKRGVDSQSLWRHLCRTLDISEREIGYAGLKDTVAVTRQYVSVPARCAKNLSAVETERIRVLRAVPNATKLRCGELDGNRFRIIVREVATDALSRAEAIVGRLLQQGVPNYFGPQRFGRDGNTLRQGLALLRGERRAGPGFMLRLTLSAVQSALFNLALAERLRDGTLHRVESGEVLQVVNSGGLLLAADVAREQTRCDQHQVVPTGPMFGPKMRTAAGAPGDRERQLLARAGLAIDDFARFGKLLMGTRRPLLVWPAELALTGRDTGLEIRLALPAGTYATVVLQEIVKNLGEQTALQLQGVEQTPVEELA